MKSSLFVKKTDTPLLPFLPVASCAGESATTEEEKTAKFISPCCLD
jgi:hypothetical protein